MSKQLPRYDGGTKSTVLIPSQVEFATGRGWAILIGLWAVLTAYNLFKPYHVDDTAYLEIARWIQSHPFHPMSGIVNWGGIAEPIWHINQPHLYFYLLALWARIFGFSEPAMHVLQSFTALACVLLFYRLARALAAPTAIWATAILVLGPAFIVEQNLMVDVPLLATWLAFFNLLICGVRDSNQTRRYALAALICAAALLIKYSSLVLFPILCASLIAERRRRQAWTPAITLAMLAAWSWFNYLDYGGLHILTRPHAERSAYELLRLAVTWLICLGALTPLGFIAAVQSRLKLAKAGWAIYAIAGISFAALPAAIALGLLSDHRSDKLLWLIFAGNTALICFALAYELLSFGWLKLNCGWIATKDAPALYLFLWLVGTTAFYVLFSPFIAARHVLLILPPVILLLVSRWDSSLTRSSRVFGLAITVLVSAGLCLSDWRFAAFYRSEAITLTRSLPRTGTIWISGHWGWQWYTERNGLQQVDVRSSQLHPEDLLLVAREVDHQALVRPVALRLLRTDTETHPLLNLFCTGRHAVRFYDSWDEGLPRFFERAPWSLSRTCINHVDIFRVEAAR
jgi:4-amino-4-deoxy-L-arabinose transferase-like glycosyltransferase